MRIGVKAFGVSERIKLMSFKMTELCIFCDFCKF